MSALSKMSRSINDSTVFTIFLQIQRNNEVNALDFFTNGSAMTRVGLRDGFVCEGGVIEEQVSNDQCRDEKDKTVPCNGLLNQGDIIN